MGLTLGGFGEVISLSAPDIALYFRSVGAAEGGA